MHRHVAHLLAAIALAATAPAFAQSIAHGEQLYNSICRACHGFPPVGGPEFTANNPGLITTALSIIPQMKPFASQVSAADAMDISAYIASLQGGGGGMSGAGGGTPPPPQPAFDYTDLWFNSAESGWGVNVVQHASGNVFAVIFTYDTPNRPLWLVMPGGTWTSSTVFTGSLYRVTGSPANAAFKAGSVFAEGTATFTFTDASHGTLAYTANGSQVTKAIEKQAF
ncbi:MAG TPA: cytochrome c [Usitatibacter sp.]|jgi:cytochrome c553|nr:cytochrome c [Usitatibacter sp.]